MRICTNHSIRRLVTPHHTLAMVCNSQGGKIAFIYRDVLCANVFFV